MIFGSYIAGACRGDTLKGRHKRESKNAKQMRNKTVFHTRLRHPETINSVPLNSVLRIK